MTGNVAATQTEMPLQTEQNRSPYWRFFGDDWGGGTRTLTLEQRGFYVELLNAMWAEKGPVSAEPSYLSKKIGCDPRVARRVRDELVKAGKITISGGRIRNARMEKEIAKAIEAKQKRCGTQAGAVVSDGSCSGSSPDSYANIVKNSSTKTGKPPTPTTSRSKDSKPSTTSLGAEREGFFKSGIDLGSGGAASLPRPAERRPAPPPPQFISEDALNAVREVAPGWDRQFLHHQYLEWSRDRERPRCIDKAFLGWVKSFTKGKRP